MSKVYILEIGIIGSSDTYDIEREVYSNYGEACYQMEKEKSELIGKTVRKRHLNKEETFSYSNEVEDTRGYSNDLNYVSDPDGEWFIRINSSEEE